MVSELREGLGQAIHRARRAATGMAAFSSRLQLHVGIEARTSHLVVPRRSEILQAGFSGIDTLTVRGTLSCRSCE